MNKEINKNMFFFLFLFSLIKKVKTFLIFIKKKSENYKNILKKRMNKIRKQLKRDSISQKVKF